MIIRAEQTRDIEGIREVEILAFERAAEADLVDALRAHGKATLSLVAEEDGAIVGHVLFSPARIGETPAIGMGPVAVRPARQGQGIGSALIRAGLAGLRQAGHTIVIVEGDPNYYTRFGFQDATPLGITCEFNPPPGCFMVQALTAGALASLVHPQGRGVQRTAYYAEEFQAVG
jgi:putative acetyltransferase